MAKPNQRTTLWQRFTNAVLPRVSAHKEMGVSGTAVFGGYIRTIERSAKWVGLERYRTSADIAVNISIVAAGLHHFLNLIAHPEWSVKPKDEDNKESVAAAEFVESVMEDLDTPWSRVVRRAGMYRFHGFGIQEWTAKKREDGKIGFMDIEPRPQFTIEKWEVDEAGEVLGVWQRSPQTGQLLGLPRGKIVYLVDDTLSDSPEGLGLFRHMAEPYERLKKYLQLEALGFERDLRGTPIGRAPLDAINKAVKAGTLSKTDAKKMTEGLEAFCALESKTKETGIVLDSKTYESINQGGISVSGAPQWDLSLLTGTGAGLQELNQAVDRIQREIARIMGVEHLMMGDTGGNRALAEDKSRNLYLVANAVLQNIAFAFDRDLLDPLWKLNGLDEEIKPTFSIEDVAFRSVQEITDALAKIANAGVPLMPNDEVINDVRDLLGVSRAPEPTPEMMGMFNQNLNPDEKTPGKGNGKNPPEAGKEPGEKEPAAEAARSSRGTTGPNGAEASKSLPRYRPRARRTLGT